MPEKRREGKNFFIMPRNNDAPSWVKALSSPKIRTASTILNNRIKDAFLNSQQEPEVINMALTVLAAKRLEDLGQPNPEAEKENLTALIYAKLWFANAFATYKDSAWPLVESSTNSISESFTSVLEEEDNELDGQNKQNLERAKEYSLIFLLEVYDRTQEENPAIVSNIFNPQLTASIIMLAGNKTSYDPENVRSLADNLLRKLAVNPGCQKSLAEAIKNETGPEKMEKTAQSLISLSKDLIVREQLIKMFNANQGAKDAFKKYFQAARFGLWAGSMEDLSLLEELIIGINEERIKPEEHTSYKESLIEIVNCAILAIDASVENGMVTCSLFPDQISKTQLKINIKEALEKALATDEVAEVPILSEAPLHIAAEVLQEIGTLENLGIDKTRQDVFEKINPDKQAVIKGLPTKKENITVTVEIKTDVPPKTPNAPISDWASISLQVAKKGTP